MNEKFKKTLKSSKQGIWIILILAIALNAFVLVNSKSILDYAKEYWTSWIFMSGLIAGLVLYAKEKYRQGAEIVQWAALGNIILSFTQAITVCVITKTMAINVVSLLVGALIPIILIIESLKVIRLSDEPKQSNTITIVAIVIISLIVISQIIVINIEYKTVKDIISGVKDPIDNVVSGEKEENKNETSGAIVEDAIYEYNPKVAMSLCADDEYLYKKVRLPKININTNVVKKLNKDILNLNENIATENSKGGYDLDIDYTYKEIPSKDLLFVKVTKVYTAHCATGRTKYYTYIYDKKNDKVLTFKELLNMYKIEEKTFEECAYDELERYLNGNTEDLEGYKERLKESIKNKTFSIQNIDNGYIEVHFPVDLFGFSIKI